MYSAVLSGDALNWRQARRTALIDDTRAALDPLTDEALTVAADGLVEHLTWLGRDVRVGRGCSAAPRPSATEVAVTVPLAAKGPA
jgi:hypothetical protein